MTDEEKKEMARLQEEVKSIGAERAKLQEEHAKLLEEKKAVEAEKKRIALREQCEKELPKGAITPGFLKLLEECSDAKAAIDDRKAMILEAQKGISFSRDNTMPVGTKTVSDDDVKAAFRE